MKLYKYSKLGILIFTLISLSGCGVDKGAFTDQQICIATIAKVMGRDPSIIKVDSIKGNITYLSYDRKDDGKHWASRCKVEQNKAIWASTTGRWRVGEYDSKITFSVYGNEIKIYEKYSDESSGEKKYNINQLAG